MREWAYYIKDVLDSVLIRESFLEKGLIRGGLLERGLIREVGSLENGRIREGAY